jgi:ABC-2 type transport system ATP-binding protein
MPEAPAGPDVALRVADLTRRYGDLVAVDRLSFAVHRGEVLGFLGPNGAGKTTTLKMLCGLLRPDNGTIEIDGRRLRTGDRSLLPAIGVSPQSIVLWETLTCLEQLEFAGRMYGVPRKAARRRAEELLAVFGLEDKRDQLGRTLSGGMQRRLNIALALVHEPEILFLDEPQAGLDPQSRVLVREYIRSLAGRMTVVLTTHDMEEAEKLADRVCIIDHGRLLVLDTIARIKEQLGEGDLFELEIAEDARAALLPLVEPLLLGRGAASVQGNVLSLTAPDAAAVLTQVLQLIDQRGLHLRHLRLRPRTLEDVFIRLTGRGLRE